jgi:IS4 transposase
MTERVDVREWMEFQWPYLMAFLGGERRVNELAYETGAFARARKIESPEVLLRMILTWAVAERSLMDTTALAAEAGLADVSDVALVKRIAKAGDWIGALLSGLLADREMSYSTSVRVRLLDATSINREGKRGIDHRVHLGMDLGSNRIDSIELTSVKEGERLERFSFRAGEIVVGDRGYGQRAGLAKLASEGVFFVIPFAWSNVPLETADGGGPFDLFKALRSLPDACPGEFEVGFRAPDGVPVKVRLVTIRKSEPAAALARQRALAERKKHGTIDVRTLEAAGYVFLLTTLPPSFTAESVLQLYRFRWQIEMKFKTLKSVLHLGNIPSRTEESLRVYVLAKLLIALLIEELIFQAESFSPWGYPISAHQHLAPDSPVA